MKLFFVVGTRPNLIKLSPIISLKKSYPSLHMHVVHTGQHSDYEMSAVFFKELDLPDPCFFLEADNSSQARQTASIMVAFEDLCVAQNPQAVIVFGDVNSTLAACLVTAKLHIPLFHIEAGLRSFNMKMPEEVNRLIADKISDVLYAPSQTAMLNLKNEGLKNKSVFSGDIMFDAVIRNIELAEKKSQILEKLEVAPNNYYLATLHRPYNVDDNKVLSEIIAAFAQVQNPIVFAVHPRTYKNLKANKLELPANIIPTQPLGYFDFLKLQKYAIKIITDSGGIQKEAFFLGKNCITLRPETEWVETVESGLNLLVKTRKKTDILKAIKQTQKLNNSTKVYGEGKAAQIILNHIQNVMSIHE